ncbi:MAG: molybdopterin-dependent oxidoreductase [Desulfobacteraceae bacterium]|nr:molybdopterin-dependent oxidoreductase [Desulfobacteraceae bacterium]
MRLKVSIGLVFIFGILSHAAFADPEVRVITTDGNGPQIVRILLNEMKQFPSRLKAVDPNFKKNGPTEFRGITIKKLLSLAAAPDTHGVTICGADQYIGFMSLELIQKEAGLLVWEMDGKKIEPSKGGPLKIIYPDKEKIHGACYIWYVQGIFAGPIEKSSLKIIYRSDIKNVPFLEFVPKATSIDPSSFSIPSGCRTGIETNINNINILDSADLFSQLFGWIQGHKIRFVPYVGKSITIHQKLLKYPIYIAWRQNDAPIHPAFGGPFSVIFPVEEYPELAEIFPEYGALFFLKEIWIE